MPASEASRRRCAAMRSGRQVKSCEGRPAGTLEETSGRLSRIFNSPMWIAPHQEFHLADAAFQLLAAEMDDRFSRQTSPTARDLFPGPVRDLPQNGFVPTGMSSCNWPRSHGPRPFEDLPPSRQTRPWPSGPPTNVSPPQGPPNSREARAPARISPLRILPQRSASQWMSRPTPRLVKVACGTRPSKPGKGSPMKFCRWRRPLIASPSAGIRSAPAIRASMSAVSNRAATARSWGLLWRVSSTNASNCGS